MTAVKTTYSDQARTILGDSGTTAERHREFVRTPLTTERREIAHEALVGRGYTPSPVPDETGATIYRYDESRSPTHASARSAFATLTLLSGGRSIAVNPRHVAQVWGEPTHGDETITAITFANGEIVRVLESVDEAVAALSEASA